MPPRQSWDRYARDLGGAWNAIDDLRSNVDYLETLVEISERTRLRGWHIVAITLAVLPGWVGLALALYAH